MKRSGGERRGGMLSDDASRKTRKIEVKINIIITYDILPPPRPPHSKCSPCAGRWRNDSWGGGLCFGGAVEAAAWIIQKFFDSEFNMAVDKIKGKQATIN